MSRYPSIALILRLAILATALWIVTTAVKPADAGVTCTSWNPYTCCTGNYTRWKRTCYFGPDSWVEYKCQGTPCRF
jgi:hypothetical protein